jgi:hypothetical protein
VDTTNLAQKISKFKFWGQILKFKVVVVFNDPKEDFQTKFSAF